MWLNISHVEIILHKVDVMKKRLKFMNHDELDSSMNTHKFMRHFSNSSIQNTFRSIFTRRVMRFCHSSALF